VVDDWNSMVISEFRANGGKMSGQFEGAALLLLHTTGAKSGADRVSPVMFLADGDRLVVFATKAGADTNPDWYHNLLANPKVTVEIGAGSRDAVARIAEGEERSKYWEEQKRNWPGFADYETKTSREIPVVVLEPAP
jgi:deazaflavin-dependent oxidoreductase (nitroreductase family)